MKGEQEDNEDDGYLGKTMEIREKKMKPRGEWLFGVEDENKRKKKEIKWKKEKEIKKQLRKKNNRNNR